MKIFDLSESSTQIKVSVPVCDKVKWGCITFYDFFLANNGASLSSSRMTET